MVRFSNNQGNVLPLHQSYQEIDEKVEELYNYNNDNDDKFWLKYKEYLLRNGNKNTANIRLSYSKKYYHVLLEGNAQDILSLSNQKRLQVMKSLASLSKFLGCYDRWKSIKDRYQLKWSNGDNSLEIFQNIVNNDNNLASMIKWLKVTCSKIPKNYSYILIYCSLTGLRADEACTSIRLIQNDLNNYLNKEKMILEHFRYPSIFIRRTKQAYISIVSDSILNLAKESGSYSYNALRCFLRRKKIQMNMNYCRKIFATYLRNKGVEQEVIDVLQGRISKSIFVRHYYKPAFFNDTYKKIEQHLTNLLRDLTLFS